MKMCFLIISFVAIWLLPRLHIGIALHQPHIEPRTHYRCLRCFFSENCLWLSNAREKLNAINAKAIYIETVWRDDGQSQPAIVICFHLSRSRKLSSIFCCVVLLATLMPFQLFHERYRLKVFGPEWNNSQSDGRDQLLTRENPSRA
jgi:hypothetical protein